MNANNTSTAIKALQGLLGPPGVICDRERFGRYCRDWSGDMTGTPLAILRPSTTAEVSQTVQTCAQHGLAIIPQGGHTGLVGGAIATDPARHVIVSLERLNRIRSMDTANFSMVVDAGCVLETVKAAADKCRLLFPLSLGAQGSCQIGGNVATNAGGVNVLRYGMMRDLVLGLEVVLPDGRVWNGLRALRKNNTGIDIKQIFVGSEGTMGIVTAAALKLFPKPGMVETAFLGVGSVADAIALYTRARHDCSDLLTAFELIQGDCIELAQEHASEIRNPVSFSCPFYVLMEVSASGAFDLGAMTRAFLEGAMEAGLAVDGVLAASHAQAREFWRIREGLVEAQVARGRHLRTDVSVPISAIAAFIEEARVAMQAGCPQLRTIAYGHVGDGNVHFNALLPAETSEKTAGAMIEQGEDIIMALVDRFGGSISAEHGIGRAKRGAFLQRLSPEHRDILTSIMATLNPHRLMNPGCMTE